MRFSLLIVGVCTGFQCKKALMCVAQSAVCDNIVDCPDKSDERTCGESSTHRVFYHSVICCNKLNNILKQTT